MKRFTLVCSVFLLCFSLSACNAPALEVPPTNTTLPVPSRVPVSEKHPGYMVTDILSMLEIPCGEGEKIQVLDANPNRLLLNFYREYEEGELYFSEVGYSSVSSKIGIYDLERHTLTSTWEIGNNGYCSGGKFIGASVVFVVLTPVKGSLDLYTIYSGTGETKAELVSGNCYAMGFSDPRLAVVSDSSFVYSYSHPDSLAFGVNQVELSSGEITPQIALVDDGETEELFSTLVSDGSRYSYFAAVENTGIFFIGSSAGIDFRFPLTEDERLYDYCFLGNRLFLTMELLNGDKREKVAVIKDFQGNTLLTEPCKAFYRIVSNNDGLLLGIDDSYQVSAAYVQEDRIDFVPVEAPAKPVLFYYLNGKRFFIYYHDDPQLGLKRFDG